MTKTEIAESYRLSNPNVAESEYRTKAAYEQNIMMPKIIMKIGIVRQVTLAISPNVVLICLTNTSRKNTLIVLGIPVGCKTLVMQRNRSTKPNKIRQRRKTDLKIDFLLTFFLKSRIKTNIPNMVNAMVQSQLITAQSILGILELQQSSFLQLLSFYHPAVKHQLGTSKYGINTNIPNAHHFNGTIYL